MSWSFSDFIQFAQDLVGADTGDDATPTNGSDEFPYTAFDDDDLSVEQGSSDLSMDEFRQSLDEYEEILRS